MRSQDTASMLGWWSKIVAVREIGWLDGDSRFLHSVSSVTQQWNQGTISIIPAPSVLVFGPWWLFGAWSLQQETGMLLSLTWSRFLETRREDLKLCLPFSLEINHLLDVEWKECSPAHKCVPIGGCNFCNHRSPTEKQDLELQRN